MAPTFRQLQYFVVLSEELNFGRAAQRLNISQPPLSAAIRQLEDDLGARLFDRNSKRVSLTRAGAAFGARARRMLAYMDETLALTRRAATEAPIELVIGFAPSMIFRRLPDFLRAFEERHPMARVTLREMNSMMQIDALVCGQIDLGFIHGLRTPEGVSSLQLMSEPFICCLPSSNPLARAPFVALSALKEERFVIFARRLAPDYHDHILAVLRAGGGEPTIVHEVDHWLTVLGMVAMGMGIALMPQSMARSKMADVAYLPLDRDYGRHETRCVWRDDTPQAGRELMLNTICDVLRLERPKQKTQDEP